jgi:hypothetical protein
MAHAFGTALVGFWDYRAECSWGFTGTPTRDVEIAWLDAQTHANGVKEEDPEAQAVPRCQAGHGDCGHPATVRAQRLVSEGYGEYLRLCGPHYRQMRIERRVHRGLALPGSGKVASTPPAL